MILETINTREVGVKIRTREPVKHQYLTRDKRSYQTRFRVKTKPKKYKKIIPLALYYFFELEALVTLKASDIGRPQLIQETVWENVEFVQHLQTKRVPLTKYIVKINGMTYRVDTEKITISIYEPITAPIPGTGGKRQHKYAGSE